MQIFDDLTKLETTGPRLVVGLGNFDGVHLGHRRLIGEVTAQARELSGTPAVFTFHPHPLSVLDPAHEPPLLLTPEARQRMVAGLGVEMMFWVPFTLDFARLAPETFIDQVLYRTLQVNAVVVGYNYNFGHRGEGTPALLAREGTRFGFDVRVVDPVRVEGMVVSSTHIRRLLQEGDVGRAHKFLGYRPFAEGLVVHGDSRGATLGFPTANLDLDPRILVPADGVYAVEVQTEGMMRAGVANIGSCPTFRAQSSSRRIEVHILDFSGNIYGRTVTVHFNRRLRGEMAFERPGDLVEQIERDIAAARGAPA
ncbi:MAG TPA: bifunctional riboflavin kinase/FAD synthetase [Spirochaetia bacterium]|nr:bifunctional riboflavin kinase/FAD synthetase [Spirochaetia bacterium]